MIDAIMVSPEFDVLAASIDRTERDGRYPSDHFPVTARLRRR
jgi:endonuclease/exonuclease/phosphatase family metal-dependent hydrolase